MIESDYIKRQIVELIANCIDEETFPFSDRKDEDQFAFVEMYGPTIHVAIDKNHYYKIILNEIDEDDFDIHERYNP